jgi:hypothetical protein
LFCLFTITGEVSNKNNTFKVKDVLRLSSEAIEGISGDLWSNCCSHVIKLEDELVNQEKVADDFLSERLSDPANRIVINLGEDSDDSEDEGENELGDSENLIVEDVRADVENLVPISSEELNQSNMEWELLSL